MIVHDALPGIKRFLKPVGLSERPYGLVVRCVAALCLHRGRMRLPGIPEPFAPIGNPAHNVKHMYDFF